MKRLNRADVEPFAIDIDDFRGWCTVHGRPRDAAARSEYVVEKLGLKYQASKTAV